MYLTRRFIPNFMNRYIIVPVAAIRTTKIPAFRVTPLVVSGKMVMGTMGALDVWRPKVSSPARAMAEISGANWFGFALNFLPNFLPH